MDTYSQAKKELDQATKLYTGSCLLFLPLCLFALLFVYLDFLSVAIGVLACSLIIQLAANAAARKHFSNVYNHHHLLLGLSHTLEQVEHVRKKAIPAQEILDTRLVPVEKAACITAGDYISGQKGGYGLELCDAAISNNYLQNGKTKVDISLGIWFSVTLPYSVQADWRLIDRAAFDDASRREYFSHAEDLELADLPRQEDNEAFYFYRSQSNAEVLPAEAFLKQLQKYKKAAHSVISVAVCGNKMICFLSSRMVSYKVKYPADCSEKALNANPIPEVEEILHLARLLEV